MMTCDDNVMVLYYPGISCSWTIAGVELLLAWVIVYDLRNMTSVALVHIDLTQTKQMSYNAFRWSSVFMLI